MINLQEIIDLTRLRLGNYEPPYYWTDRELVHYCNETINRIAMETGILEDSTTTNVTEIYTEVGTASYQIPSNVDFIRSVHFIQKETLVLDVAPSVAWSVEDTITGETSGATSIICDVLSDKLYVIEQRNGSYSNMETLTNGTYEAIQGNGYPQVTTTLGYSLKKTSVLDTMVSSQNGSPTKYMLDYTSGFLTLTPPPEKKGVLKMSVIRRPITVLYPEQMSSQEIEMPDTCKDVIINGMCAMAYLKNGENTYNPNNAALFSSLFKNDMSVIKIRRVIKDGISEYNPPHRGFM